MQEISNKFWICNGPALAILHQTMPSSVIQIGEPTCLQKLGDVGPSSPLGHGISASNSC